MSNKYDDIIGLPHHQSATRPRMSNAERAAQFSPFAALTGYEGVIDETVRLTDERLELSDGRAAFIDRALHYIKDNIAERPNVTVTYFVPDAHKQGGAYLRFSGQVKRLDEVGRKMIFTDRTEIPLDDLFAVEV